MKTPVQTYQTNDVEGQLICTDHSPKYTKASKIVLGLIVAGFAVAAVFSAFATRTVPALTNLQEVIGEKGKLKRGMVTDPSQLSPGLQNQLAGTRMGKHGLAKKGLETSSQTPVVATVPDATPISAAKPYKPPESYTAQGYIGKLSAVPPQYTPPSSSAPAASTIRTPEVLQPPPAALQPSEPTSQSPLEEPTTPVAPSTTPLVAPLTQLVARPPVSSVPTGEKIYGEKALLKRGAVEDLSLLSPGLLDQLAGAPVGEHGLIKKGDLDITQASPGLTAHLAGVAAGQHDAKIPGY